MFKSLQRSWRHFRDAEPGARFMVHYREHQAGSRSQFATVAYVVLGAAMIVVGVVGLVVPGPGILGIALGAAIMAQESETASKALDHFELWIWKWVTAFKRWWGKASLPARFLVTTVGCIFGFAGAAAVGYFVLRRFFD